MLSCFDTCLLTCRNIRVVGSSGGACAGSFLFLPEVSAEGLASMGAFMSPLRVQLLPPSALQDAPIHMTSSQADIDACVEYIKECAVKARSSWRNALKISEYVQGETPFQSMVVVALREPGNRLLLDPSGMRGARVQQPDILLLGQLQVPSTNFSRRALPSRWAATWRSPSRSCSRRGRAGRCAMCASAAWAATSGWARCKT